jgi:predicted patatin/cPLA2 family phospholipase
MAKPTKTNLPRRPSRPPFDCIALLLQGGGALGAYQAGVYEALAEANLHPDWTAGISIGGGVITYALDGKQYVATTSGVVSGFFGGTGTSAVIVFALP